MWQPRRIPSCGPSCSVPLLAVATADFSHWLFFLPGIGAVEERKCGVGAEQALNAAAVLCSLLPSVQVVLWRRSCYGFFSLSKAYVNCHGAASASAPSSTTMEWRRRSRQGRSSYRTAAMRLFQGFLDSSLPPRA